MLVTPSSFAMLIAITSPRALNDPVGNRPSSFTHRFAAPLLRPIAVSGMIGVAFSPRLTIFSVRRTGSNSR